MAWNSKGYGPESLASVSTIVAQTPPTIAPTNFIGNSSLSTAITLTWSPVIGNINTGFSAIRNYTIYQVTGVNENLISTVSSTTITLSSGISAGNYTYKIAAVNDHGEGVRSTSIIVLAASAPSKMDPVKITHPTNITSVRIEWTPPVSDGGDTITGYWVLLLNALLGIYVEYPLLCDGSNVLVW